MLQKKRNKLAKDMLKAYRACCTDTCLEISMLAALDECENQIRNDTIENVAKMVRDKYSDDYIEHDIRAMKSTEIAITGHVK